MTSIKLDDYMYHKGVFKTICHNHGHNVITYYLLLNTRKLLLQSIEILSFDRLITFSCTTIYKGPKTNTCNANF